MSMEEIGKKLAREYGNDNNSYGSQVDFLSGWRSLTEYLEILGYDLDELALGGEFIPGERYSKREKNND